MTAASLIDWLLRACFFAGVIWLVVWVIRKIGGRLEPPRQEQISESPPPTRRVAPKRRSAPRRR